MKYPRENTSPSRVFSFLGLRSQIFEAASLIDHDVSAVSPGIFSRRIARKTGAGEARFLVDPPNSI